MSERNWDKVIHSYVPMWQYYRLLRNILQSGNSRGDRTGTGTRSLFGEQIAFDLSNGFPLLTGKFTPFNLIATELLWFLEGSTDNDRLKELNGNNKQTIWEEWITESGDLGPIYGHQWRSWGVDPGSCVFGIDQIEQLVNGLLNKPFSRRHIVSAWNVEDLPDEDFTPQDNVFYGKMALAPCHTLFQCYVEEINGEKHLSLKMYQRSADMFLGVPFNIASYALLTHMLAQVANMKVKNLIISFGDVHIYNNHIDQAIELLSRDLSLYKLPTLELNPDVKCIDDFTMDDIKVVGYHSHTAIKAEVSV